MLMTGKITKFYLLYAGIMLDAFAVLLCSRLCWHNWLKPSTSGLLDIDSY